MWDRHTGTQFLVDSGADECVFPASVTFRRTKSLSGFLAAAKGSKIDTWGQRPLILNLGKNKAYQQDFYLADVTRPILGANFFSANNIAIDLRGCRLIDLNNFSTLPATRVAKSITKK